MESKRIRTAAYCRVSTDREEQEGFFQQQVLYYTTLIQSNPEMEFAGIYGDKGKSGLAAGNRPGLQKLLEDCRNGKIGPILTKSVSRLSRNMPDLVTMIRELKQYGVHVQFERENIDTRVNNTDFATCQRGLSPLTIEELK